MSNSLQNINNYYADLAIRGWIMLLSCEGLFFYVIIESEILEHKKENKKMKTRTKIIIGAIALALIGGGIAMGQVFGFGEDFPTKTMSQKEKQLAYLKEHEQEIVDFVKRQNPKVESVQVRWNETRWLKGGNMFETQYFISVFGGFNHIENSGWGVDIFLREDGTVDMDTIGLGSQLKIGGELFE